MANPFDEKVLADKLSKLNGSQQCVETLSHWCIFHRKKVELVVGTWDKQFHSSSQEQKLLFLYLANDILQNGRRNGTEFINEFWKVLPAAVKDVVENGDARAKKAASRLVDIWEERKVFGSHAQGIKDLMLGKEPPPPLELNKKRSRSVRIVKRDSRSIRIKLAIGGTTEKIVSAFHSVLSEHPNEDSELNKCKAAVRRVGKMEKDVQSACSQEGDSRRMTLADELQREETLLQQCIEKLKSAEETRLALVSRLKEALQEQESELENVRTQLQVAQGQVEEARNMRRRLNNEPIVMAPKSSNSNATPPVDRNSSGETHKKTAAAIADKLAASTSSFQMMTSILSTFAAEEAKNAGVMTSTNPSNSFQKPENPIPPSNGSFIPPQPRPAQAIHLLPQTVMVPQQASQTSTSQPQYQLHPTPTSQQYLQPPPMIGMPYAYGSLPPPPPLPQQQLANVAASAPLTQQLQQQSVMLSQQPIPLPQQQLVVPPPSYRPLQPPGMQFYGYANQAQ